jgi:hypothetical protein
MAAVAVFATIVMATTMGTMILDAIVTFMGSSSA